MENVGKNGKTQKNGKKEMEDLGQSPELPKCPVKLARSRKYMIHRK